LSGRQNKPAALVIRVAVFEVGLGGGRSAALGDGMGQVASFYLDRIRADSLPQQPLPNSPHCRLLRRAMPPPIRLPKKIYVEHLAASNAPPSLTGLRACGGQAHDDRAAVGDTVETKLKPAIVDRGL
jgi:hypothetical protein